MWIHQRTSRNTAISYPLWPLVFVVICLILGVSVFVGRYPWVAVAVLVALVLGGLAHFRNVHGGWSWPAKPNPEFDLDEDPKSPDGFVDTMLKPYRDQIRDTKR